jgi:hypothetical protein
MACIELVGGNSFGLAGSHCPASLDGSSDHHGEWGLATVLDDALQMGFTLRKNGNSRSHSPMALSAISSLLGWAY